MTSHSKKIVCCRGVLFNLNLFVIVWHVALNHLTVFKTSQMNTILMEMLLIKATTLVEATRDTSSGCVRSGRWNWRGEDLRTVNPIKLSKEIYSVGLSISTLWLDIGVRYELSGGYVYRTRLKYWRAGCTFRRVIILSKSLIQSRDYRSTNQHKDHSSCARCLFRPVE